MLSIRRTLIKTLDVLHWCIQGYNSLCWNIRNKYITKLNTNTNFYNTIITGLQKPILVKLWMFKCKVTIKDGVYSSVFKTLKGIMWQQRLRTGTENLEFSPQIGRNPECGQKMIRDSVLHVGRRVWNDAGSQGSSKKVQEDFQSSCMVAGTWSLWTAAAWWRSEGTSLWTLHLCT